MKSWDFFLFLHRFKHGIFWSFIFTTMLQNINICVPSNWSLKIFLNIAILVAFQHISVSFKNNWGSTTIALFLLEMCFVSYMLFSACGHVGACRSGLFVEAMFLDIVKLNTRLNSISMLKSSVWCHWKQWRSQESYQGGLDEHR